jgi:ubiquinone/menaquinone biosynthesis C-methylase UbiE
VAGLSPARKLLKLFHPEGIPRLGTVFYNVISGTGTFQKFYELVAKDILSYCSEGSILDIGTGPGWLLVKLYQLCPGLKIAGVDISPSMVARAERNLSKAGLGDLIVVKESEASHIPFPDGSFDTVVSTGSIHHWKKPADVLNEAYRLLKYGGIALIYDVISDAPSSVWEGTARDFGRLKSTLLFLHTFDEPFYSYSNFELLARPTLFREGQIRFAGPMCCLVLRKEL